MGWACCMAAPAVVEEPEVAKPRSVPAPVEEPPKLDLKDCIDKLHACYQFHAQDTRAAFDAHVQEVVEAMVKTPVHEWMRIGPSSRNDSHGVSGSLSGSAPRPHGDVVGYDVEHARAWFLKSRTGSAHDQSLEQAVELHFRSCLLESIHDKLMSLWERLKPEQLDLHHVEDESTRRQAQLITDGKALGELAEQLHKVLGRAVTVYVPAFAQYSAGGAEAVVSVAASLMHQFVRDKLLAWLPQLRHLDPDAAYTIGACDDLQAKLIEVCAGHSSVLKVWSTTHYVEPLFSQAMKQSEVAINDSAKRVLGMNQWHGSPVFLEVLDIMRLCDVALDQHQKMITPLHISLARHQERLDHELVDVIGAVCAKFGAGIIKGLPSASAMQPRPNELRRFKERNFQEAQERAALEQQKELERQVKEAQAGRGVKELPSMRESADVEAAARGYSSFIDDPSSSLSHSVSAHGSRTVEDVSQLSFEDLTVRVNSLYAMQRYLEMLKRKYVHQVDVAPDAASSHGSSSFMFNSENSQECAHIAAIAVSISTGLEALEQAQKIAMNILAHYVLFIALKPILEDGLYLNDAAKSNAEAVHLIRALREQLDIVRGALQEPESLRLAGRCLMHCTAAAFVRVLLDGGPLRFYKLSDVLLLKRDVTAVQDVLARGGMHISNDKAQEAFQKVHEIIQGMSQPTADLIALHQRMVDGSIVPGCVHLTRLDVLYILTHRADRDASKYLKETMAMPKVQGHTKITKLKNFVKRGMPRRQ